MGTRGGHRYTHTKQFLVVECAFTLAFTRSYKAIHGYTHTHKEVYNPIRSQNVLLSAAPPCPPHAQHYRSPALTLTLALTTPHAQVHLRTLIVVVATPPAQTHNREYSTQGLSPHDITTGPTMLTHRHTLIAQDLKFQ